LRVVDVVELVDEVLELDDDELDDELDDEGTDEGTDDKVVEEEEDVAEE